jgi:hypothetical protein
MATRGEKPGRDLRIGQPMGWVLCRGPYFSGAVGFVQLYWVSVKGCCVRLVVSVYVLCVLGFSCRMYIDSNGPNTHI